MKIKKVIAAVTVACAVCLAAVANPLDCKNQLGFAGLYEVPNAGGMVGVEYEHWINKVSLGVGGYTNILPEEKNFNFELYFTSAQNLLELRWGRYNGSRLMTFEEIGVKGLNVNGKFMADAVFCFGFGYDILLADHLLIPFKVSCVGEAPNQMGIGFGMGFGIKYVF